MNRHCTYIYISHQWFYDFPRVFIFANVENLPQTIESGTYFLPKHIKLFFLILIHLFIVTRLRNVYTIRVK